jgi:hypothetical protein
MVGLLGWVISPSQGPCLHIGQHKRRLNAHRDIHAVSGIWTHDHSVRMKEDRSCLRQHGHRDWRETYTLDGKHIKWVFIHSITLNNYACVNTLIGLNIILVGQTNTI